MSDALETTLREEEIEDTLLQIIKEADLGFNQLDALDGWELSERTLPMMLGVVPCLLLGIGDMEFRDLSSDGLIQKTNPAELLVYVADTNNHRRREGMSRVRRLKRQVRQLLRGRELRVGGALIQIRLRHDAVALAQGGLIIYEQLYHLHAMDHNAHE